MALSAFATALCEIRRCSAMSWRLCPSAIASRIAPTREAYAFRSRVWRPSISSATWPSPYVSSAARAY